MSILGPLTGEAPEPMTRDEFFALRRRIHAAWNGLITIERKDAEKLVEEIAWLKKRLRRVEDAIQPLVEDLLKK